MPHNSRAEAVNDQQQTKQDDITMPLLQEQLQQHFDFSGFRAVGQFYESRRGEIGYFFKFF